MTPFFPMVCQYILGVLGPKPPRPKETTGITPPYFPVVTFYLGGLRGRLLPKDLTILPMNVENLGPKATQAKGNHWENGGFFNPDFSTELSPKTFEKNLFVFPQGP